MTKKSSLLLAALIAVAMVGCTLAAMKLHESMAAALQAAESLSKIKQMQLRITQLRRQDLNAHLAGEQPTENSNAWVVYCRESGITEGKLVEINRLPLKKVDKTSYSRDDVFLRFNDVSASNIVQFLVKCCDASIGYSPVSVHMTARPPRTGELESWNVSLVLTRLLYTAKNQS